MTQGIREYKKQMAFSKSSKLIKKNSSRRNDENYPGSTIF